MAEQPIAVLGSMHECPMCTGTTQHKGGKITTSGAHGVTIDGKPIALQGDQCACTGATDTIAQGSSGVFVDGIPVATVGCMTAHGGIITTGIEGVTISSNTPKSLVTLPVAKIPFPETTALEEVFTFLSGNSNREARNNQDTLKGKETGEPRIINPRWIRQEVIQRNSQQIRQITLVAEVYNIPDGQTITLSFDVPKVFDRPEESVTLSGKVQDKKIEVLWEIEDLESNTNA